MLKTKRSSKGPLSSEGDTLLRGSVRWHGPLAHDMVPLGDLAHHTHGVLLALVVLAGATRGHIVLL